MASIKDVEDAIEARAKSGITAIDGTVPIDYDNIDFQSGSGAAKWALPRWLQSARRCGTLGPSGNDKVIGVYQITMAYPTNSGTKTARTDIGTLESYFKIASSLSSNGQALTITGTDASPGRTVDNSYRRTLTVYFEAEVAR
jgi:hypothetical protein